MMAAINGPRVSPFPRAINNSNVTYGTLETRNVKAYARLRLNTCQVIIDLICNYYNQRIIEALENNWDFRIHRCNKKLPLLLLWV